MALGTALEDASAETRVDAAAAIIHAGMGIDKFIPAIVRHAVHDPDQRVRSMCGNAIGHLHTRGVKPAAIPELLKALESSEPGVREEVSRLLGRFGRDSASAIPALIRFLEEPYDWQKGGYQGSAAAALGRIAPGTPLADQAVAALTRYVGHDWSVLTTTQTIEALAEFGPKAAGAIPKIRELQQHEDEHVRNAATAALAKIPPAK